MINHENDDTLAPRSRVIEPRPQTQPLPSFPPALVDAAGETHPGNVRPNNEDHFLITRFGRFIERVATNLPKAGVPSRTEDAGYGLLVADGMGGHAAGETASRLAIETLMELSVATPDWILRLEDAAFSEEMIRRMKERFGRINAALVEQGKADPKLRGLGTTMTVACSLGRDLFVFNIGDSRASLYRAGSLRQLTHDHTFAQKLADQGIIAPGDVATHRMKHVLTRVLGVEGKDGQPDVLHVILEDGDTLLLSSDGLTDMVGNDEIAAILATGHGAAEACHQLVETALRAGGKDNVTVVMARYRFPADSKVQDLI